MPKKLTQIFVCAKCGAQSSKWNGRCLDCGAWGTLSEEIMDWKKENDLLVDSPPAQIIDLEKIESNAKGDRIITGFNEIDRVFGGGIVIGSLTLLSGDPGIGKSTILAQIADAVSRKMNSKTIYVSGEESANQVKGRLERLDCKLKNISFISETNVEKIISAIKAEKPSLVIIDSIQTVYSSLIPSEAGGISQIRSATVSFLELAKKNNISIILVGHITKDGQVAGPKSLEHIVDTVLYLESENQHDYRLLRTNKNRFGSVNELGVFEMTSKGFKEISNPSAIFLEDNDQYVSGSVISCIMEGTRPFLVEIQALVTKTVFGYPQRKTSGFDLNRLQILTAVLSKRANINLTNQDVVLNIVGGMKISDPSLDLAVCAAIATSLLNANLDKKTIFLGEVGLGGEIRNVSRVKEKLYEAEKLGLKKAIIPDMNIDKTKMEVVRIRKIEDIVKLLNS